jgi:CRP-like cAMP-binding protein
MEDRMETTMQGTGPHFADVVVRRSIVPSVNQPPPRDALVVLDQFGTIVSVQHDRQIHGQGDEADFCYRILSGCVRTVKLMEDGRRQIGEFLMAGDLLGFDALKSMTSRPRRCPTWYCVATRGGWWKRWPRATSP